jgi:hypothetical protein
MSPPIAIDSPVGAAALDAYVDQIRRRVATVMPGLELEHLEPDERRRLLLGVIGDWVLELARNPTLDYDADEIMCSLLFTPRALDRLCSDD